MKKLSRLNLNALSHDELEKREMSALRGGKDACGCSCGSANISNNQVSARDSPGDSENCSCLCGGDNSLATALNMAHSY